MYPREAIEACEALTHPLPHPTMPIDHSTTDDRITEWLHQADGGAKVDTKHPGHIEMLEDGPSEYEHATRRDTSSTRSTRCGWGWSWWCWSPWPAP